MGTFDDRDWENLVRRIRKGLCTPFLGAGINQPFLMLGRQIAERLAEKYAYPFSDRKNLISVAQYVAIVRQDPMLPKEEILAMLEEDLEGKNDETLFGPSTALHVLGKLPFSTYITTNYDNLMCRALVHAGREPRREYYRWNATIRQREEAPMDEPSDKQPIVYHLHGLDLVRESLVLTEDDYVTFLVNLSKRSVPDKIERRLAGGLLFLGYSLEDWNFRVLHQGIMSAREATTVSASISVQLAWEENEQRRTILERYLESNFKEKNIRIFWGRADEFLGELERRWNRGL